MLKPLTIAALVLATACSRADQREASASSANMAARVNGNGTAATDQDQGRGVSLPDDPQLAGRWVGPEGLFAELTPLGDGRYRITMQYDLDHTGTFDARRVGDTLELERPDGRVSLSYGAGAQSGMKWVAPGAHCLIARVGHEAYCREGNVTRA